MKKLVIVFALFVAMFSTAKAEAGIFGRRRPQPQQSSQPQNNNRSYSYQPTTNPFPFNSRSKPEDWHEMHRGYGIKIRGW